MVGQALGVAQWQWWRRDSECQREPDGYECFCESARQHRVCRGNVHFFDLSDDDQNWVCLRFPDFRWCPDPEDNFAPSYGYFSAVIDYQSPQWRMELYFVDFLYRPADLSECALTVITQRGRFPLNRELVLDSANPFILHRNQFGSAPLGTPRHVDRLRIECRLAGSGEIITEMLNVDPGDVGSQRWARLR